MAPLGAIVDPYGYLQRTVERPGAAVIVDRLAADLSRRPAMPWGALALTAAGLALIVALTLAATGFIDNWGAASEISARAFRPWFRIALLAGVGVMLTGVIAMLLAIIARIFWLTQANRAFLPTIIDARRQAAGRSPRYGPGGAFSKGG